MIITDARNKFLDRQSFLEQEEAKLDPEKSSEKINELR